MKHFSKTAAAGILALLTLLTATQAARQTHRRSKEGAVKAVRRHVEPKQCFIELENSKKGYRPIPGTGCAHWVAHVKEIRGGHACLAGYTYRVTEIVSRLLAFTDLKTVQVGDVWARIGGPGESNHCGIVSAVATGPHGERKIRIKHCSSFQERGVVEDDYDTHLKSLGKFYRSADRLFSGTWASDEHGRLELQTAGKRVTAQLTRKDGTVLKLHESKIAGRSFTFRWQQGSRRGSGTFNLSAEGDRLKGTWANASSGAFETWTLSREYAPRPTAPEKQPAADVF